MKYYHNYPYESLTSNFSDKFHIIKSIHELICKDDDSGKEAYIDENTPIFDDEWLALDLDELERELAQNRDDKTLKKSMDMGFFIGNEFNQAFVLIEIRFNFKQFANILKTDLDNKVNCSTDCIKSLVDVSIYDKKYFLFAKDKVQQGKSRLNRMNPKCSQDYIACGVKDIYELFFQ